MASLRDSIQSLRCQSAEPRLYFVPAGALNQVLTIENVRSAYRHSKIQPHREKEVVDLIIHGGRRTFAILITIYKSDRIIAFIEKDELQRAKIDAKLPFSVTYLKTVLSEHEANDFFDKQWEFTAPVFIRRAGHRLLSERTIFPFLPLSSKEKPREGYFGTVFKVKVHQGHGRCFGVHNNLDFNIVRKELKATNSEGKDFDRECTILSYLNCLQHPNIIELLGSYTCNGIHSLLFPEATGDLDELFKSTKPMPGFTSEADYLFALCGLASAIEKLHVFFAEDLNIRLIGCHHDLKPKNVLIQHGTFLLADFGLSNFKEVVDGSKTPSRAADDRYMAPECEDSDQEFKSKEVGRKSDIWSFGCILSETITYMMRGSAGIKEYHDCRKVTLGGLTFSPFHAGQMPNNGVVEWLTTMEAEASLTGREFIELARKTLRIKPERRPSAEDVTQMLRYLAFKSKFQAVRERQTPVLELDNPSLNFKVEIERFYLWGHALGLTQTIDNNVRELDILTDNDFFQRHFNNISSVADLITDGSQSPHNYQTRVIKLRMAADDLVYGLPHASQVAINSQLEQKMVSNADIGLLQQLRKTFKNSSKYRGIETLAAVKYMYELCKAPPNGCGNDMLLQSVSWKNLKHYDHFTTGMLSAQGITEEVPALVEQVKYEEHWVGRVGDELFSRIGAVAELLRFTSSSDSGTSLLSPIGYFHTPGNRTFSLAFEVPDIQGGYHGGDLEVVTLRTLIDDTQRAKRPSLEDRLLLARRITSTLVKLHKASWLHKNISAFAIIFPISDASIIASSKSLALPYLVGFNYSRPDDPKSFSSMSEYSLDVMDYHHPEYREKGIRVRYRLEFDYYSLGLVLLEIGLWRSLKKMTKGKETHTPKDLAAFILKEYVTQLKFYVGIAYQEMVTACLNGRFLSSPSELGHIAVDMPQTLEERLQTFCSI